MAKGQMELLPITAEPMPERVPGRYAIMVREYQSVREVELLRVDSHPEAVVKALRGKTLRLGKRTARKYISVYAVRIE